MLISVHQPAEILGSERGDVSFALSCPDVLCPDPDKLGAKLNPRAGAEAVTSTGGPHTVAIKISEGNRVTMKAGELKQ